MAPMRNPGTRAEDLPESTSALVDLPPVPEPATAPGYGLEERLRAALGGVVRPDQADQPDQAVRPVRIAGVDEVGRGAWAGPVVVCAAITDFGTPPAGLTDSKLLTARRREQLAVELVDWLAGYAYGASEPEEIDEVGMTEALGRAASRALAALPRPPDAVILDGKHNYLDGLRPVPGDEGGPRRARSPWQVHCAVGADRTSVSVAAASVLAKVHRDGLMATLDCPGYGFAENAGYPAPCHRTALAEHGPTPYHRLSWSYLDDLPRWRHLKKHRDPAACEGQLELGI